MRDIGTKLLAVNQWKWCYCCKYWLFCINLEGMQQMCYWMRQAC